MYDQSLGYGESFFYNDKRKFVFCRIPKVACTTWKKVLAYTLDMVDSPFNVSLDKVIGINVKSVSVDCREIKHTIYSHTNSFPVDT